MKNHVYSKFKIKNIPYAKVGRRVFVSLFNAETYCTAHDLNPDEKIEYREDQELKKQIEEIAKYQKAILDGVKDALEERKAELNQQIEICKSTLETCHYLDKGYWEDCFKDACTRIQEVYEMGSIVWKIKEELERVTGWHD